MNTNARRSGLLALLVLSACGGQSDRDSRSASVDQESISAHRGALSGQTVFLGEGVTAPERPQATLNATMQKQSALVIAGTPLAVDTTDREAVRRLYNKVYLEPAAAIGWTGDYATGSAGTNDQAYQQATIQRVNWFRAMAGVPAAVTLSSATSMKAQQAALMMSANNSLFHYPPETWKFYTSDGAEAAKSSNIAIGVSGRDAINAYISDYGASNGPVGHRRWIFAPNTRTIGTGDVPGGVVNGQTYRSANALWVFDVDFYGPRRPVRDEFVAWPPRGFVPYRTVYNRWSLSYPAADFSQSRVTVARDGVAVDIQMEPIKDGYGENTIVWRLDAITQFGNHDRPDRDIRYQVTVSNVLINKQVRAFTYDVMVFDTGPILTGPHAAYTILMSNETLTLLDNTGRDGTQTIKNPVRIDFTDLSLAFDFDGNAGKAYRLYRAAFNRKPDTTGLGYWIDAMDRGASMATVARGFSTSVEFASLYGAAATHAHIVKSLYLNVLHREPDAAGADYWIKAMERGAPVADMLIAFSESAENKMQVASETRLGIVYKRASD